MQYNDWLHIWLENYVKPTSKQKTYVRYSEIVSHHISGKLGEMELAELTPLVLQKFTTDLTVKGNVKTGKGLAPNSVNGIITVIQNSLNTACYTGQVSEYSADKIRRPKSSEKQITCFTSEEQKLIERAILGGGKTKLFGVVLCLYTGLRIGELLALEWSDIDFAAHTLTVGRTCYDGKDANGKFVRITGAPKTQTSKREIPVPRQLMTCLKSLNRLSRSPYVVTGRDENAVSVRSYQRSFESLLRKLRIQHRGFHALRHTFATRALECGMDVKTLSEILGHKNPTVTLHRYVHSLPEHKKEMMNRVGKLLG